MAPRPEFVGFTIGQGFVVGYGFDYASHTAASATSACWCRTTEMTALADRLAAVSSRSTCRLTHRGRKSGNPYEVTIWFLVDGETVYLATANASRQWVRNVQANPSISWGVGGETFTGTSERVRDATEERHVMDLVAAKYWYLWPLVGLARLLGYDPKPDASFRVRLAT